MEEVEEEEDDDADEDYVSDKLESGEFQDSISPDYQRRAQRIGIPIEIIKVFIFSLFFWNYYREWPFLRHVKLIHSKQ